MILIAFGTLVIISFLGLLGVSALEAIAAAIREQTEALKPAPTPFYLMSGEHYEMEETISPQPKKGS